MTTLLERVLRSAAEDLGLSPQGWTALDGDLLNGQSFRHPDRPSLVIEVVCDGQAWSWSTGGSDRDERPVLLTASGQPWACVHDLAIGLHADARAALLAALAVAGDDLREARLCSTAMLHTRLAAVTGRRGTDVFVAPVKVVPGRETAPAAPRALVWDYRSVIPDGTEVSGTVVATDEVTAEDLAVHTCPVLHLISLRPRLAGLSPLPQIQAGAALELLFPASGDIAASR